MISIYNKGYNIGEYRVQIKNQQKYLEKEISVKIEGVKSKKVYEMLDRINDSQ